jgi:hypothetical protein
MNNNDDFNLFFNKLFTKNIDYNLFKNVPNTFYDIELFTLIDVNNVDKCCKYCNNDDYPIRLFNHCLKHISSLKIKELYNDATSKIEILSDSDNTTLKLSVGKAIAQLKSNINHYKKINKINQKTFCSEIDNNNNHNNKFIINNCLSYDMLAKEYNVEKYIKTEIDYTFDVKNVKCINEHSLNLLKYRQMLYEYKYLEYFFVENKSYKIHIDNAENIYTKLLESNSLKDGIISNIELEKGFFINTTKYRSDIYLDVKVLNKEDTYIRTIIEVDESQHYNSDKAIYNDRIKDIYWVQNNFAIIRVDIGYRKVNEDDIRDVIRHLMQIHLSGKQLYIFSERYIMSHEIVHKYGKGIHITRDMLGEI